LIEFAVAIPVIIAIVYYLHDVPKYKRMQAKMEFITHEIVGMIQNVSQSRTSKKITSNDLRYCISAAFLSFYPGTTQFAKSYNVFKQPGFACGKIFYVVGNDKGKASVLWAMQYQYGGGGSQYQNISPGTVRIGPYGDDSRYITRVGDNKEPSEICPKLSIKPGETKIIIENFIYFVKSTSFKLTDNRTWLNISPREAFGFLILTPKAQGGAFYFTSIVIFTPKPGLFDETAPV
jgi:hypothetical protein